MRLSPLKRLVDFGPPCAAVDLILSTPGVSDADKVAMLGGTAMTLRGIKA